MTTAVSSPQTFESIKQGPHWSVVIRPSEFLEQRVSRRADCWSLVRSCQVRRSSGHTYPELHGDEPDALGSDWVASEDDWSYWRMYQSGQFVHLFTFAEDNPHYEAKAKLAHEELRGHVVESPQAFLDTRFTLRTITDVYEFASRLAARNVLGTQAVIDIRMAGVGRRLLSSDDAKNRLLLRKCSMPGSSTLERNVTLDAAQLLASPADRAIEHALWFFEGFSWRPSSERLVREQRDLGLRD